MRSKVLVDFKDYTRLQDIEQKYFDLQREHSKQTESIKNQHGSGLNDASEDNDANFHEPDEVVSPSAPIVLENPPLPDPGLVKKQFHEGNMPTMHLSHIRKEFRPRATKLLEKLNAVSADDIQVLPDYSVEIDGKLIENSHLSDLVASIYYPKRQAVGKREWLKKLQSLHFLRKPKSTVIAASDTGKIPDQWWYIGDS